MARLWFLVWFACCCLPLVPASAADVKLSLDAVIEQATVDVLADMKSAEVQLLEIAEFTESRDGSAQGGPGLRQRLIDQLEKKQPGVVKRGAPLVVKGEFSLVDDPRDEQQSAEHILLTVRFTKNNRKVNEHEYFFFKQREIAELHNVTVEIPANLPNSREENKHLRDAIEKPKVALNGKTRIQSTPGSPYSLEIAVKPQGAMQSMVREASVQEGRAFVPIQKTEQYEIIFHNESHEEVAVAVSIDGYDVFTFSDDRNRATGKPAYTHFIVKPKGTPGGGDTLKLPGWHKTNDPNRNDNFLAFLVTEYGKGASSKASAPSPGKVGAITLSVSRSHLVGDGQAKSGAETGFGPPIKADLKPEVRKIDPPHEFISVRYLK